MSPNSTAAITGSRAAKQIYLDSGPRAPDSGVVTAFDILPDPSSPLARESAAQAFADLLDGDVPEAEIEAFLIALSERGETSIEIAEAAVKTLITTR